MPNGPGGTFLRNHAHVLLCNAKEPEVHLRKVAHRAVITERAVQRIVADERTAASWIEMNDAGETYPGLSFFDLADDLIVKITDFWPEAYEPSAARANLTERT